MRGSEIDIVQEQTTRSYHTRDSREIDIVHKKDTRFYRTRASVRGKGVKRNEAVQCVCMISEV